ncbi:hypothetical protein [Frigoriglobus tundricola]|uniref:Uncharacterized protein n=1 Tax=Frigoriglobus tundricola TaxID=2774151 RepID=A0A6M5YGT7_9BACT|nr:hypothetical protein [Frigoriglobus tundricola]QJW93247.1 hypothetical protein FTUN_0752 [Frigoriglobus tundricola]
MWKAKLTELIEADTKGGKVKYLRSVLRQVETYGERHFPTPAQLRILAPMWQAHEKRRIKRAFSDIIGDILA